MQLLLALALLGCLVIGIELVLNQQSPASLLRGFARGGIRIGIVVLVIGAFVTAMRLFTAPPPVSVGSNNTGAPSEPAFAAMLEHCTSATGIRTIVHAFDPNPFQDAIEAYLRGTPDDAFTWFAGERMRALAAEGLVTDISDVWTRIGERYNPAFRAASTGDDGRQYLVPLYTYPWVVMYRRSLFDERGYAIPATLDELTALASRMQAEGLVPLASGDKDGWPPMGTFDILDMRMNGYQFHRDLLAGRERWTDPRVEGVFRQWVNLLAFTAPGSVDRTWQEAAQSLLDKRAGMYFFGTFAGEQAIDGAVRDDLGMFPFPLFGNAWDAEHAIDAPIDGAMLSRSPASVDSAKALLECLSTGEAQLVYSGANPNSVAAAAVDTRAYPLFQRRIAQVIRESDRIAMFLDRDTRPDFAGADGMQRLLRDFLTDPGQDLAGYLRRVQAFWDALPPLDAVAGG